MSALKIVVFYAAKPDQTRRVNYDISGPDQIDLLYKSIGATNSDATLVLLTTSDTDLSALRFPFERFNGHVDFSRLMLDRTRMQKEYVASTRSAEPMAFLDSDILLCRDLSALFAQDFDIGLTWRSSSKMPINGGVIFASNRHPAATVVFFEQLERIYRDQQADRVDWYGDQYALAKVAGSPPAQLPGVRTDNATGLRYLFLPREQYNYTPNNLRRLIAGPRDAHLMHFKGQSRRYMEPYWRYWIGPGRSSLPRYAGLLWTALKFAVTTRRYRHGFQNQSKKRPATGEVS